MQFQCVTQCPFAYESYDVMLAVKRSLSMGPLWVAALRLSPARYITAAANHQQEALSCRRISAAQHSTAHNNALLQCLIAVLSLQQELAVRVHDGASRLQS